MRVSKMVRWSGLAGVLALVAACSDAPTAVPTAVATSSELAFAKGGKDPKGKDSKDIHESKVFTVVPGQPLNIEFGNFKLTMPANALCAQNQGYGREYWNLPCELEKSPVTFVATWTVEDGAGSISFNHDRRFNPAAKVYLSVKTSKGWKNTEAILWLEGEGSKAQWVDEGTYDRDMKTYTRGRDLMWRRLKHFSGYNMGEGASCDQLLDPGCSVGDAPINLF